MSVVVIVQACCGSTVCSERTSCLNRIFCLLFYRLTCTIGDLALVDMLARPTLLSVRSNSADDASGTLFDQSIYQLALSLVALRTTTSVVCETVKFLSVIFVVPILV